MTAFASFALAPTDPRAMLLAPSLFAWDLPSDPATVLAMASTFGQVYTDAPGKGRRQRHRIYLGQRDGRAVFVIGTPDPFDRFPTAPWFRLFRDPPALLWIASDAGIGGPAETPSSAHPAEPPMAERARVLLALRVAPALGARAHQRQVVPKTRRNSAKSATVTVPDRSMSTRQAVESRQTSDASELEGRLHTAPSAELATQTSRPAGGSVNRVRHVAPGAQSTATALEHVARSQSRTHFAAVVGSELRHRAS